MTTFVTMAYIIVVNPRILAEAGMPIEGVLFATCVSAAVATLVMGLWANYLIALAPGMSRNAYFTYSVVIGRGIPPVFLAHRDDAQAYTIARLDVPDDCAGPHSPAWDVDQQLNYRPCRRKFFSANE